MASPVKSPKQKARKACVFCGEDSSDEDMFGKLLTKANLKAHYFCMLFSSGLSQNGKSEKQGILGFLPADITKEVRRSARLRCSYCKRVGATIGCVMKNCKKSFHLGCGRRNDTLHQFFDTFCSYCPAHRPQQEVEASDDPNVTCSICMVHVTPAPSVDTLQAPCCKKNWYHRDCIQRYANSAGLYFFKCPLCNNKDEFQNTMLTFGIYIPDQDASWETEPHAYQELLERYRHCDAQVCKCAEGRKYDKEGTKWEIILCEFCGSQGSHVACNHLLKLRKQNACTGCYAVDQKIKLDKKIKSPGKRKSLEMPFLEPALSPDCQKGAGSLYPGPSNKMRKKGLPRPVLASPEHTCPILSPQEKVNVMSSRMKMTPKSKSVLEGKKTGKRMSVASPNSKTKKAKRQKVKSETQTYAMFKAEFNGKCDSSWSSDDDLTLAETKKKASSVAGGKSVGEKKEKSDNRNSLSGPSSSALKKNHKKKGSIENDSSQTTITQWFKARPSESKYDSLRSDNSQTSIIKWFKNRSTALENVGAQPISQPVVAHQPKKTIKRPKTVEWKGKQLLIKSPRVVLRKDTRLGKLKPRNLTIDMNDRKGNSSNCDQNLLTLLDTDVRLTRNMVQTDIVHKRASFGGPRELTIDMNDRKGNSFNCDQNFLTMIDTDVRLTRNMVKTDIVNKRASFSGPWDLKVRPEKTVVKLEAGMSPKVVKVKAQIDDEWRNSPSDSGRASTEVSEMGTQTPAEENSFKVCKSEDKDQGLRKTESQDSRKESSVKEKTRESLSSGDNVKSEDAEMETYLRKLRKQGRTSTAYKLTVGDRRDVSGELEKSKSTSRAQEVDDIEKEKIKSNITTENLYFRDGPNNGKVVSRNTAGDKMSDSPAKNLRKHKTRSMGVERSIADTDWTDSAQMKANVQAVEVQQSDEPLPECKEDEKNSTEEPKQQSTPTLIKLKKMLKSRVESFRNMEESCLSITQALTPSKSKDERHLKAELNDGELTPTSQIHKPFDFSTEKVNKLISGSSSNGCTESPKSVQNTLKLYEASPSGNKRNSRFYQNNTDKVLILESPRRSPRARSKSSEKLSAGTLGDYKNNSNLAEGKTLSTLTKVGRLPVSPKPRSSPRLRPQSADNGRNDKSRSTSSPSLSKKHTAQSTEESLKRKFETVSCEDDVDSSPSKRPLLITESPDCVSRNITHSVANILDLNKTCTTPKRIMRSNVKNNSGQKNNGATRFDWKDEVVIVTSPSVKENSVVEEELVDRERSGNFTKLTPRRSPRKLAEGEREKSLSPTACKSLLYDEEVGASVEEKKNETQSMLNTCKPYESLMNVKLSMKDKPTKIDKVLRQRTRSSMPGNCAELKQAENSLVWSLPGTRQLGKALRSSDNMENVIEISKPTHHLLKGLFAAPALENTSPNIKFDGSVRGSSLPLKKRKCVSTKLDANSDIRDFLGKSHSMFFSKPEGLSRSNSDCSDVSGVSGICNTALKLSPSYVTKFRRSHSRTDVLDISQSVVQNLSTFSSEESSTKTDKRKEEDYTTSGSDNLSDKLVMADYYAPKAISKKRRSIDSVGSVNSDDSDLMIISPVLEENVIEIT